MLPMLECFKLSCPEHMEQMNENEDSLVYSLVIHLKQHQMVHISCLCWRWSTQAIDVTPVQGGCSDVAGKGDKFEATCLQ